MILKKDDAGEFSLHLQTFFRLSCGNDIVLAANDLYQPSEKVRDRWQEDEELDLDIVGNNRLDEILETKLHLLDHWTVQTVKVSRLGDIQISFSNGFLLEALIDVSGSEECWRFFAANDDDHLVITGQGIEDAEE